MCSCVYFDALQYHSTVLFLFLLKQNSYLKKTKIVLKTKNNHKTVSLTMVCYLFVLYHIGGLFLIKPAHFLFMKEISHLFCSAELVSSACVWLFTFISAPFSLL